MTSDLAENYFELSRFATNYDYVVSGLASKFLNHFKKKSKDFFRIPSFFKFSGGLKVKKE